MMKKRITAIILMLSLLNVFLFCGCVSSKKKAESETQKNESESHSELNNSEENTSDISETEALKNDKPQSDDKKTTENNSINDITEYFPSVTESVEEMAEKLGFFDKLSNKVNEKYYENTNPAGDIEKKYTALGSHSVLSVGYKSSNEKCKRYAIWYPSDMTSGNKKYPLVVMANGTGITAPKYKEVFMHLASWGFIVVGNEDENSWSGESSAQTLDFMIALNQNKSSIFYQKIDTANIGIAGHSQGGVGAINAVTNQKNGKLYKAMFIASTTHLELSQGLGWPYEASKIQIPCFMVAGTLKVDAGDGVEGSTSVGIAPLFSLQENYKSIPQSVSKVMARRKDKDHGDMLRSADGYMTAWFMYYLKGDAEAGKAFFGKDAELFGNPNWQDVKVSK